MTLCLRRNWPCSTLTNLNSAIAVRYPHISLVGDRRSATASEYSSDHRRRSERDLFQRCFCTGDRNQSTVSTHRVCRKPAIFRCGPTHGEHVSTTPDRCPSRVACFLTTPHPPRPIRPNAYRPGNRGRSNALESRRRHQRIRRVGNLVRADLADRRSMLRRRCQRVWCLRRERFTSRAHS